MMTNKSSKLLFFDNRPTRFLLSMVIQYRLQYLFFFKVLLESVIFSHFRELSNIDLIFLHF